MSLPVTKFSEQEILNRSFDDTNNALKTLSPGYSFILAAADVQVKSGAGFLHTITISADDAAPTAGTIILYDSLTETGTEIFNHTFTTTAFLPFTLTYDLAFSTGLYLGFTTTADVNVTVTFK